MVPLKYLARLRDPKMHPRFWCANMQINAGSNILQIFIGLALLRFCLGHPSVEILTNLP